MSPGTFADLRRLYHAAVFERVLRIRENGAPNNADAGSVASVEIGRGVVAEIGLDPLVGRIPGQTAGRQFEEVTMDFLRSAFLELQHLRPGDWRFSLGTSIDQFAQYRHLGEVRNLIKTHQALRTALGDYIVTPDVVVCRSPITDELVNVREDLIEGHEIAGHTPLREANNPSAASRQHLLQVDHSQRPLPERATEGLNLTRNRKGVSPHVAVVTAEPLPSRIASLALGTGDIDCVYHFALPELQRAAEHRDSDHDLLATLVNGGRLRDISDLPFDLAT